jgi:hypothetical protein
VDWNSAQGAIGRMVSLGFEALYTGGGWSQAFILYATYDFAIGSEYDTFARPEDRVVLEKGSMPDTIEVDGVKGFVRFHVSPYGLGGHTMYKCFVFPDETGYVAVVYELGQLRADADWAALIEDLSRGAYPPELQETVVLVDGLAMSLVFKRP